MKFTRDLCRLLGLGGEGPGEEEEEVLKAQDDAPQPGVRGGCPGSEARVNSEECLDDKERARRRAERRRARRKRQKERRKLEREERLEDALEQEEEAAGAASESDCEEKFKEEDQWTAVRFRNKCNLEPVPPFVTTEKVNNHQLAHMTSEEETEWDVSSAFVANAASHIKIKGLRNRAAQIISENMENDARSSQGESTEEMKRRGESLTEQGIQMFGQGQYSQAVDKFTEAISCDPQDHRFYGNRSYCYWFLEQYSSALKDAQRSIELAPDWPKGYFRKGCSLMGLKRYSEAEKSLEQVLKLDQHIKEASSKLFTCRILQLMEMGFEEEHSKLLLDKFKTVQGVLTSEEVKAQKPTSLQDQSGNCRSLWVGNITIEVTEKDLWDLFKIFGEIESIRILHERFCAFINFQNANMAAKALEKLRGVELGGSKLVMRYPDRWIQRTVPSIQRTNTSLGFNTAGTPQSVDLKGSRPRALVDGDQCFYWQTGGCIHGDRSRFKHILDHQRRSKKP